MLAVDPNLLAKSSIAQSLGSAKASPWICCQIGGREHYAVPRALYRHGALQQMITDAWVRPGNPLGLLSAGLKARFHAELGKVDVYGPAIRSLAFELRARRAAQAGWPLVMARNCWFQRLALARLSKTAVCSHLPAARDGGPCWGRSIPALSKRRSSPSCTPRLRGRAETGPGRRRPTGRNGGANARWPNGSS